MCQRIQVYLASQEPLRNEDMDVDDLLKNRKVKKRQKKN